MSKLSSETLYQIAHQTTMMRGHEGRSKVYHRLLDEHPLPENAHRIIVNHGNLDHIDKILDSPILHDSVLSSIGNRLRSFDPGHAATIRTKMQKNYPSYKNNPWDHFKYHPKVTANE